MLPTQEQAAEAALYMGQEYFIPAFHEKLAAYGIKPQTEQQFQQLLQIGALLHQAEINGAIKTAQTSTQEDGTNPFLTHALQKIAGVMQPSEEQVDTLVKQATYEHAAKNPLARTAALLYNYVLNGGEVAQSD